MGSFTPLASGWWVCVSAWGILTSVLIDCVSYRVNLFDESLAFYASADRYQLGHLGSLAASFFRLFPHVRNLDALQHGFNAFVHLAQRFANIAAISLVALSVDRDAGRDEQGDDHGLNHFESGNRMGGAGQRISTVGAVLRLQESGLSQALQNLR